MLLEVFRSGNHTDSNGKEILYSIEQIKQIVQTYNEFIKEHPNDLAPLVKGHPQNNAPAFGWVKKLVRKNSTIFAELVHLDSELILDMEKHKFKNFSIALYPNLLLRHIGILGAVPPAVKGLNKNGIVCFHSDLEYTEYNYIVEVSDIKGTNNVKENADIKTKTSLKNSARLEKSMDTSNVSVENTVDGSVDTISTKGTNLDANRNMLCELQQLKEENARLINKLHSIEKQTFLSSIRNFVNSVCNSPNSPISSSHKNGLIDILEHSYSIEKDNFMNNSISSFSYSENSNFMDDNVDSLTNKIKRFVSNLGNTHSTLCSELEFKEYNNNNIFDEIESPNIKVNTEKNALHKKALHYISLHPDVSYMDAINNVLTL